MAEVDNFIIFEWLFLNSILIVVSAILLSKCYKERRSNFTDGSLLITKKN